MLLPTPHQVLVPQVHLPRRPQFPLHRPQVQLRQHLARQEVSRTRPSAYPPFPSFPGLAALNLNSCSPTKTSASYWLP